MRRDTLEFGPCKIDLERPPGVIERVDGNSVIVFPVAVAVLYEP